MTCQCGKLILNRNRRYCSFCRADIWVEINRRRRDEAEGIELSDGSRIYSIEVVQRGGRRAA